MKRITFVLSVLILTVLMAFQGLVLLGQEDGREKAPVKPRSFQPATYDEKDVGGHGRSFEAWFNSTVGSSLVPAGVTGIVSGERLIYSHGNGAGTRTRFGIASLSKTFTAVMTLVLEERGILSLDDPVRKYLPNLKIARYENGSKPVTLRHLLSHTSGIPSYGSPMENVTLKNGVVSYPRQKHPAGTCYNYSNPGYVILKHVLEEVTGKSYDTILRETVLAPLGMSSSHGQESNGTGGIVSTLEDLAKFTSMLIQEGAYQGRSIISRESFRTMLAPVLERPEARVDYHYSLSWEVITVNGEVDSFYKAGRWGSQASAIQVFPKKGIALVYLANPPHHRSEAFMDWRRQLTGRLRGLLRNITDDPRLSRSWPHISSRDLNQYEGIYVHRETGHRVRVFMKGGRLYSDYLGISHPLQSFSSLRFLSPHRGALHSFVWRDEHVVGLALRNGYYRLQEE